MSDELDTDVLDILGRLPAMQRLGSVEERELPLKAAGDKCRVVYLGMWDIVLPGQTKEKPAAHFVDANKMRWNKLNKVLLDQLADIKPKTPIDIVLTGYGKSSHNGSENMPLFDVFVLTDGTARKVTQPTPPTESPTTTKGTDTIPPGVVAAEDRRLAQLNEQLAAARSTFNEFCKNPKAHGAAEWNGLLVAINKVATAQMKDELPTEMESYRQSGMKDPITKKLEELAASLTPMPY